MISGRDCSDQEDISRSCSVYPYSADRDKTLRRIQTAVERIEQEMGRLKTQDHSLHHQLDHVKKSLSNLSTEPGKQDRKDSCSAGEDDESMAALHSDTNLMQAVRNKSSNNNSYSLSQDSYMSRGEDSKRPSGAGIQRRETLAAFHHQREKAAKKERKAQSSEPEQSYYTGRREHIYETLDDVVEDYRAVCSSSNEQSKKARKHTVDIKKDRSHKPVISNLIKPHHQSADRLPSQYHPVSVSRKTSPKAGSKDPPCPSPQADGTFFSLQSADSGYNSTERGVLAEDRSVPHVTATRHGSIPSGSAQKARTSAKAEGVSPSSEPSGRNQNLAAQKQHDSSSRHRRQESSPAYLSPELLSSQKVGACEAVQQPKLVPLSKVTSPKSGKGGKPRSQKSKSRSGIGFLSTLNKVSGTESVSDFDFRPSASHPSAGAKGSRGLAQSHPVCTPRSREHEPVSYIGVVGPECSRQTSHMPEQQHQQPPQRQHQTPSSSHSQRHASGPEERKVNFKEPSKKPSSRHSSSRSTGASKQKKSGEGLPQLKYQSLSQPAPEEFEDSTLVLYKAKPTSFDDSGVDRSLQHPAPASSRRGTAAAVKSPPLHPMYSGGQSWSPAAARPYHHHKQPGLPAMEETWC